MRGRLKKKIKRLRNYQMRMAAWWLANSVPAAREFVADEVARERRGTSDPFEKGKVSVMRNKERKKITGQKGIVLYPGSSLLAL